MTEQSPTIEDQRRSLLQHLLNNPHHMPPIRRWKMRVQNGMSDEQALHLLGQEMAVADAKHAGEARS